MILENEIKNQYINLVAHLKKSRSLSLEQLFIDRIIKFIYKNFGRQFRMRGLYHLLSESFNRVYFLKNLLKNMISIYYLMSHYDMNDNEIYDIGCGAAPSTLAYNYLTKYEMNEPPCIANLLDNSEVQLKHATNYLSIFNIGICKNKQKFKFIEFKHLVIFSYFLCEQYKNFPKELVKNINKFQNGLIIIDYKENIKKIENMLNNCPHGQFISWDLSYQLPKEITSMLREDNINVCGGYFKPYRSD